MYHKSIFLNALFLLILSRCDANTDSDRVEFSNFLNAQDRKLKPYCGSQLRYMPQKSDSAFFRVTFYSNHKFDANGFLAKYHFIASKYTLFTINIIVFVYWNYLTSGVEFIKASRVFFAMLQTTQILLIKNSMYRFKID